jgi:hypothetical protein
MVLPAISDHFHKLRQTLDLSNGEVWCFFRYELNLKYYLRELRLQRVKLKQR